MRRFVMVALVALAAGALPAMVRADDSNPNQEAAKQICRSPAGERPIGRPRHQRAIHEWNGLAPRQLARPEPFQPRDRHRNDHAGRDHQPCRLGRVDALSVKPAIGIAEQVAIRPAANPLRGAAEANRATAKCSPCRPPSAHRDRDVGVDDAGLAGRARLRLRRRDAQPLAPAEAASGVPGPPLPMYARAAVGGAAPMRYDHPAMPTYAWPCYAAYPNYAAVTYPKQYSPTAWPYIGPFYPYPQVPLGWRKVNLQWDDGWWWLDFKDKCNCCWWR